MSNDVSWNLQLSVRPGRLDDARALIAEMVEATRDEAGTVGYEWFMSEDGSACHINERYVDSDAVLAHLANFGGRFVDRFMGCFEPIALSIYGDPSAEAREVLDGFGASYLASAGGFRR